MFVVTQSTYDSKKDALRRFLVAYRDSAAWMISEPKQAAKIAKIRSINGRNEAVNLEIIKLRNLSAVSVTTAQHGLGSFDLELLEKGAQTFLELGLIKKRIDVPAVVKDDLIPE